MKITVETTVKAPIEAVWHAYTTPADIKQWNAASDDRHTTAASVDLREGGQLSSRMKAKNGYMGLDFAGTYTRPFPTSGSSTALAIARRRWNSSRAPMALRCASLSMPRPRTPSGCSAVAGRRS